MKINETDVLPLETELVVETLTQPYFQALVLKLNETGVSVELHNNVEIGHKGAVYRPFVLVPTNGVAIVRDSSSDAETLALVKIGFTVLSVSDEELASCDVSEAAAFISGKSLTLKERTLVRVNLCYGRRTVKETISPKTSEGAAGFTFSENPALKKTKAYYSYGGMRVILRPKRKVA